MGVGSSSERGWLGEFERIDRAVYGAIADTPTPRLDGAMRRISTAANYSRLSFAASGALAVLGGRRGRRAAVSGLASVSATSAVVNLLVKPVGRRRRPDRAGQSVPESRHVPMPDSRSFPSGHTAAAVAFANGAGQVLPVVSLPLHLLAGLVALLAHPHRRALPGRRAGRRAARVGARRRDDGDAVPALGVGVSRAVVVLRRFDGQQLVDQRERLRVGIVGVL